MALLTVQEAGATIAVRRRNVVVTVEGEVVHVVRPAEVDEVHLFGGVELTAAARNALVREDVDVVFFDGAGRWQARLVASEHRAGERRLAQYRAANDDARCLHLARSIVRGKLANQRTFLQRIGRSNKSEDLSGAIAAMRHLRRRVEEAGDVDEARGLEGQGASLYFRGLATGIKHPDFVFERRNRRPPRDPINACLSFGYALLANRVETAVRRAGLDPYVGIFHATSRGKPSMVLDLMEEFRPVVVDRLVLRLVNRRQLALHDFENPDVDVTTLSDVDAEEPDDDRPAVYLGRTGRAILIRELGRVWKARHFVSEHEGRLQMSDIVDRQAFAMARALEEGADYESWLLK